MRLLVMQRGLEDDNDRCIVSGNPGRGLPIIAWFLGSHGITDTKTRSTLDTVTLIASQPGNTEPINRSTQALSS